jgi:hypothetical protein
MKTLSAYPLIVALFSFGLLACSKSNTPELEEPRLSINAQKLLDKNFILKSSISSPAYPISASRSVTNIYTDWYKMPCALDNLLMFKANGELIADNGEKKCDASESQILALQWKFIENETKIEMLNNGTKDTLKVLINDGTILKYEKLVRWSPTGDAGPFIYTETWEKKQ